MRILVLLLALPFLWACGDSSNDREREILRISYELQKSYEEMAASARKAAVRREEIIECLVVISRDDDEECEFTEFEE